MKIDFELLKTIDRDLYGDAMLVLILMGNNMAAENQQNHLSLMFCYKRVNLSLDELKKHYFSYT